MLIKQCGINISPGYVVVSGVVPTDLPRHRVAQMSLASPLERREKAMSISSMAIRYSLPRVVYGH
jgi:hypothetical protein